MTKSPRALRDAAETLAIEALGWLAADDELFPVFLGATGADATELRARASDPVFLASVLDFVLMNDEWVIGFCRATGRGYGEPMAARMALPGGDVPHMT